MHKHGLYRFNTESIEEPIHFIFVNRPHALCPVEVRISNLVWLQPDHSQVLSKLRLNDGCFDIERHKTGGRIDLSGGQDDLIIVRPLEAQVELLWFAPRSCAETSQLFLRQIEIS